MGNAVVEGDGLCYGRRVADNSSNSAPSSPEDSDEHLASSLRMAVMRLARRLRAEHGDENLGLSQISALASLMHGPLSPTALAQIERIQPPSMTRVITALESRGLIVREDHERDKRQSVIAITDAGRTIIDEDRARRKAWLVSLLKEMSEQDRQSLRTVLPVLEQIIDS